MKKNILLIGVLCGLFFLNSIAQADTINYSKNIYSAQVVAGGVSDSDPGPNPSVSAAVNYADPASNSANVEVFGDTALLQVSGSIAGGTIGASAVSHQEREFLANFSKIYLGYDYYLYAEKSPSAGPGVAGGSVDTLVELFDLTAGSLTWSQKLTKNSAIVFPEDLLPVAGTVNEILPLIEDHEYSIKIHVSLDFLVAGENRTVGGRASISDLCIAAVPLPASFNLFAWGLVSLGAHAGLLWYRNRK